MSGRVAPCRVCGLTLRVWPLAVRAVTPTGARLDRGADVCLACVCTLTDEPAPEAPGAAKGPR